LLQGLSTSVMGGRADVMSKIKIAARKANSVVNCTFAPPAAGRRGGCGGSQRRPSIGERLTGGRWA
jgi:hypothetical protein